MRTFKKGRVTLQAHDPTMIRTLLSMGFSEVDATHKAEKAEKNTPKTNENQRKPTKTNENCEGNGCEDDLRAQLKALGINAHHFTGEARLREMLAEAQGK